MGTKAAAQSEHPSSEQKVIVARQPIYNSRMGVFGYELLFRSSSGANTGLKPTEATAQVLASTILEFGLDKFVHNRKAVINVTPAFIEVIPEIQLPSDQVILDIPDNIVIDTNLRANLEKIRSMGYGLSVGRLANLKQQWLLSLATIFRIDVKKVNVNQLDAIIKYLRRYDDLAIQALKIENMEEYHSYRDKDIDYLQGYFLGKPRVYVSRELSTNKLAILQLLSTIYDFDTPIEELEKQITHDVSLSYKLLKLVNAPYFGVAQKVDSIKRAIVILGREEIRKWVSLLSLNRMSNVPAAMMEITILRAKLCELLAHKAGLPMDSYFTVGMFSALDIMMKQPMKSILANLPLSEASKTAILERKGIMGDALSCALAIENAQWSEIGFANLSHEELSEIHHQAIQWTDNLMRHF